MRPHCPTPRPSSGKPLRLYPPVWALARIATRDVRLGRLSLAEGGTVVISQWVVHRDPANFDRPLGFHPERWLPPHEPPPAGAYFPFGAGSRLCIGERFAWLEGVLVLATLARRWRVIPTTRPPPSTPGSPCGRGAGCRQRFAPPRDRAGRHCGWIVSPASSMATNFSIRRVRVSGRFASWIRYRIA